MLIVAYFIWVGLSIFICYKLAVGGKTQSGARALFCIALAALLILSPYWDVILGTPTMRKLCAEEGGVRMNEEVRFPLSSVMVVDPRWPRSLCLSCYNLLMRGLVRESYAEIKVGKEPEGLIEQSGIAKYWLATSDDPACAAFEERYSAYSFWINAGVPYDGKSCIASERVESAAAEFTLTYPIPTEIRRGVAVIRSRQASLKRSGEPDGVATLTHFMQLPWNARIVAMQAGLLPVPSCPSFMHPITPSNFAPELLLEVLSGQRSEGEILK